MTVKELVEKEKFLERGFEASDIDIIYSYLPDCCVSYQFATEELKNQPVKKFTIYEVENLIVIII